MSLLNKAIQYLESKKVKDAFTKEPKAYELYYCNLKPSLSLLDMTAYYLHKLYHHTKSSLVAKILFSVENRKNLEYQEKIIEDYPISLKVKSEKQYNTATNFYRTRPFDSYSLECKSGLSLQCADTHIVFDEYHNERFVKDLVPGNKILSEYGIDEVSSVKRDGFKSFMYDFSIKELDHSYYTNGILSHNTTSTVSYLLWYLCFHTDRNILIVANKGETSAEITKKLKDSYKELPFYLKPGIIVWNQKKITLDNGCTLTCKTTNKTSATGDTIHVLYFDEVAKLPANISDEFWKSIYPTMSSSRVSQIILTSTPDGKENLFYRIWDGSQKGTNDFKNFRVDWWQVPGHDEEWAAEQRRNFGDTEFEQEFGLSFDTSSTKLISGMDSKFFDRIKKEFKNVDLSMFTKEENQRLYWHPDYSPIFQSNEGYYLFVVDTAEGKEEGVKGKKDSDYNIINIFRIQMNSIASIRKKLIKKHKIEIEDCFRLFQVGIYIDNDSDEEASAEVLKKLVFELFKCGSGSIDNCRVLVEMNFNGKNFVNKFINHKNYDEGIVIKTYHTKPIPGERQKKKMGFKTTGGKHGKNYYCELGAKKIAERQIIVSQYNKKDNISTLGQINNFAKGKNGSYAGVAMHDDIAVTVLFSWRAFEEEEFLEWLQQYLDEEIESCNQKDYIKYCLRMFNEDEPEMNDSQFTNSYLGGSGGGFNSGYSRFSPRPVSPYTSQFGRVGGAQTYGSLVKNR